MSKWAYVVLFALPFGFAWDVASSTGVPALFGAGLVGAGLAVTVVLLLYDVLSELRKIREATLTSSKQPVRDYYAVEVFTVLEAGRELVRGDKTSGYSVDHTAVHGFERTGTLERAEASGFSAHDVFERGAAWSETWAEKDGTEWASREILMFEDYAVAVACIQEITERRLYRELAREVSLRVVSGEDRQSARRQVGNYTTWSRRWPTKFSDIELVTD